MVTSRPHNLINELIQQGLVTQEELQKARDYASDEDLPVDQALIETGSIDEDRFLRFVSDLYHIPIVDLDEVPLDDKLIGLVPERTARRYLALPLYRKGSEIYVAMAEPWEVARVDEVRFAIGRSVRPVLASRRQLQEKLEAWFPSGASGSGSSDQWESEEDFLEDALSDLQGTDELDTSEPKEEEAGSQQLLRESSASPIVKIVNDIFIRAIHKGASDIHIEPQESSVIVRYRIDGALREAMQLPGKARSAVVSRIKVLGGMDISVSRRPQDGRIKLHYRDKPLDLRVSTLPTYWGEKVVMRILDQSGGSLELEKLGFLRAEYDTLEAIIHQPQGMLLVTGPTGSGKTTTLYSVLSAINKEDVNIVTVEDPVEYQLPKINQVPVNPKAGMTFAAGLRSILRQDPNVIMVGEIRDQETAEIALESAETGHMVFSTLHTNSAAGAVTRFLDMDVPGYLLASSLSGVLAQRLLRRNCPDCSEPVEVGQGFRRRYNIPDEATFFEGKGCPTCDGQGTKGRMGVYELLVVDRDLAEGIHNGVTESELVDRGRRNGMHLMFEDGLIKAMQGKISPTEVLHGLETPSGIEIDGVRLLDEANKSWEERGLEAAAAAPLPAEGTLPVMVATGDDSHGEMVATILRTGGLDPTVVQSGRQVLDRIRQHPPVLVVADMDTPDLDGVAIAESLCQEPGLQHIPLLLLADTASVKEEARALDAGADDFLTQPLDPQRLMARVRRLRRAYAGTAPTATAEEAPPEDEEEGT